MDKKYTRQGSKTLSADSRRISGKNTRREISVSTSTKKDSQRGNKTSAKFRQNVDKRPKARTGLFGVDISNHHIQTVLPSCTGLTRCETSVQENIPQFDYNLIPTSDGKSNLNHLLNFKYNREDNRGDGYKMCKKPSTNARKHKYNKEQFLQANFQFVVNWKAKSAIISSPDTLVDWDFIEQINVQTTEKLQCPICLYPPVAAKLTKCGHAYCWTCILHYLALTDKMWRKCPICYEPVQSSDLKSMTIIQQERITIGDKIYLQLMRRMKGSLFVEKYGKSYFDKELLSVGDEAAKFAKFLIAENSDVLTIIEREHKELKNSKCDDNCPEFVFMEQALKLLHARKLLAYNRIDNTVAMFPQKLSNKSEKNVAKGGAYCNSISKIESQGIKYYYFYQSLDGQQIFLHPLNIKMLQSCYGSLDQAPPNIHAKIIQKDHYSMDEDNKRKFTYLAHLPLTCNFEIVEVELGSPLITEEVVRLFEGDVYQRKQIRLKKDHKEKKREVKINEIINRQMGKVIQSTANINLSSSHEFPKCGFEETFSHQSGFTDDLLYSENIRVSACSSSATFRNTYSSVINSNCTSEMELWPSLGRTKPLMVKHLTLKKDPINETLPRNIGTCTNNVTLCDCIDAVQTSHIDNFCEPVTQKYKYGNKKENDSKKNRKNKSTLLFSTAINFNVQ